MTDENLFEYVDQLRLTLKKHEAQNSALNYLLLLLAKNNDKLPSISNEYGELLIQLSQKENVNRETLEEMKKVLHTLHGMFLETHDFSSDSGKKDPDE